jgi:hypothetical protein
MQTQPLDDFSIRQLFGTEMLRTWVPAPCSYIPNEIIDPHCPFRQPLHLEQIGHEARL